MKRRLIASLIFLAPWTVLVPMAQTPKEVPAQAVERIQKEVRHELLMLPYFGVFDNIAYKVEGYKVTLMGQVTRPTLKSDAGNAVKQIEGVEQVDNQIEVLPPRPWTINCAWRSIEPFTASRRWSVTPCRSSSRSASS